MHRITLNSSSFTVSLRGQLDDVPAPRANLHGTVVLVWENRSACLRVTGTTDALGQATMLLYIAPQPETVMIAVTATHPVATADDQRSVAVIER